MKIPRQLKTLPLLALLGAATPADGQVQPQIARRYFEEVTKLCERDAGRLWGKSLCGPMIRLHVGPGVRCAAGRPPARVAATRS